MIPEDDDPEKRARKFLEVINSKSVREFVKRWGPGTEAKPISELEKLKNAMEYYTEMDENDSEAEALSLLGKSRCFRNAVRRVAVWWVKWEKKVDHSKLGKILVKIAKGDK